MFENENEVGRGARGRHHGTRRGQAWPAHESGGVKRIVLHVGRDDAGALRLKLAIHLARALDAELVGVGIARAELAVTDPPSLADGDDVSGCLNCSSAELAGRAAATPQDLAAWFEQTVDSRLAHAWCTILYADLSAMLAIAKSSDLMVLGQSSGSTGSGAAGFVAADVALAAGRPVLIVPSVISTIAVGHVVVIAWDGSREAVRALHDALPFMRDARRITILEVDSPGHSAERISPPASAAADILARHGFQAFLETSIADERSVCDAILRTVQDQKADLLIAGLFHHSRVRESILGGVSHDLLNQTPVPLLVSH